MPRKLKKIKMSPELEALWLVLEDVAVLVTELRRRQ
jgi:hypothetical protein